MQEHPLHRSGVFTHTTASISCRAMIWENIPVKDNTDTCSQNTQALQRCVSLSLSINTSLSMDIFLNCSLGFITTEVQQLKYCQTGGFGR